jgi:hypothetical protein
MTMNQHELTQPGPLLQPDGELAQVGWARQPLLDCNLEAARAYRWRAWQRLRLKRWDYYGLTTPEAFYAFTISDVGYLGSIFAYRVDFETGLVQEHTLTVPLARGVRLPRNSTEGQSAYADARARLCFAAEPGMRRLSVDWPNFSAPAGRAGLPLRAELCLRLPPEHESLVIVIPIAGRRFYYNRKLNCLPAEGWIEYGGARHQARPDGWLGNLDWGRGIWPFDSFWVWASASGRLPVGRALGLNLGFGFGDTSAATENAVLVDGRIHKLGQVDFAYDNHDFKQPWRMTAPDGRLDLTFTPFAERVARTDVKLLKSDVHQLFGRYAGTARLDSGETLVFDGLVGWAEEHRARW